MMTGCIQDLCQALRSGKDSWLLLFDIDGTLLDTGKKGLRSLQAAAERVFEGETPALDLAGSTDLGILSYFHDHFGVAPCEQRTHRFFETYHRYLEENFLRQPDEGKILEGVVDSLNQIQDLPHLEPALLTGNTERGAFLKLKHFGLDRYFAFGAYGSDRADRNELGSIARERALAHTGKHYPSERILVIGDTPKDIACAHAIGARCIAVSTGKFTRQQLADSRADWVIESFKELIF